MMFRTPLLLLGAARVCFAARAPLTQLHQFPNGTSVENLAVRSNGAILLTLLYSASIHELTPPSPSSGAAANTTTTTTTKLVHAFANSTRVNGISELTPDTFAVSANHDTIWTLDLRADEPQVTKVVTIPSALFLNGVTTLDAGAGTILAADTSGGAIWRVDTATGAYGVALRDETMAAPAANASAGGLALGVNGVRYDGDGGGGYVYYTNTGKGLFCRVKVDGATGEAVGPYETVAEGVAGDDFALVEGAAFVASGSGGVVERVYFDGRREVVAGDVAGATSAALGRLDGDAGVLYVTTSGGGVGGGKVVAVEVS